MIKGKSIEEKKELLEQYGITYDSLPEWQRKGVNVQWHTVEKEGWNPVTQTKTVTTRKELRHDLQWPCDFPRDAYKFDVD
jgi:tRNA(His) 5'-end guanylyltransferase